MQRASAVRGRPGIGRRISGNAQDGVYEAVATFPQFSGAGTWHVVYLEIADAVGNVRRFGETDLINSGFPTQLEVTQNRPPLAMCRNANVSAGPTCTAYTS